MAQKIASYVNPVLAILKRLGGSARPAEVCAAVIKDLGLDGSPLLKETLKSGVSKFENRIAWVRMYLVTAGYIGRTKRGVWELTEKGRTTSLLSDQEIHKLLLDVQRQGKTADVGSKASAPVSDPNNTESDEDDEEVPDESNYQAQLLDIIRNLPPKGFEHLCQFLLRESGFEQVDVTGRSGDGGIDGVGLLKVNPFVAFKVLFQCKRYIGSVGAPEVRNFRGAMQGRADKGIVLTTGTFTVDACREAVRDGVPPIELVDGEHLVELCEKFEFGLTPRTTFDVDVAFFDKFR